MSDLVPVPPAEEPQVPAERSEQHDTCQAATPQFTVQQRLAMQKAEREAQIIRDAVIPAAMASSIPVGNGVGASGFKVFRDQLLKSAGNPSDPVELMMVEQLSLAHFRIARLHSKAEAAKHPVTAKSYASAAARLLGEFRRLALALREYRRPLAKKFAEGKRRSAANGRKRLKADRSSREVRAELLIDKLLAAEMRDLVRLASASGNPD